MSEASETSTTPNGEAPPAAPPESSVAKASEALKVKTKAKVDQAIALAKDHPLGAVVAVAAAAALVEVELAAGILTGLGATALLASQSGPKTREQVVARGKEAVAKAKLAFAKVRKAPAPPAPPPAEAAVPPAA
jgi:hypothetical protein